MSYEIVHFAGHGNIVSVAVIIDFEIAAFNVTSPIEVDIWVRLPRSVHNPQLVNAAPR